MKTLKTLILEKLKISSGSCQYSYGTCMWNRDELEHLLTFFIYDTEITDSFFEHNTDNKISENTLAFYSEDKDGNYLDDYTGIYDYNDGENFGEISYVQEDIEELFGTLDYNDTVNIYYYSKGNSINTIIYESQSDDCWYYSIFGDKDLIKLINLLPPNLVEEPNDQRPLLQAYEINNN